LCEPHRGGRLDNERPGGLSAGGGLEYAFARNWSLKTEYLHYDLGSVSYALSPSTFTFQGAVNTHTAITSTTASLKFTGDIVRAGVNYRF